MKLGMGNEQPGKILDIDIFLLFLVMLVGMEYVVYIV